MDRANPLLQEHLTFRFTGSGAEYFRIWIVNVFLTVITLGVYSAWAKVRRNRYLYGSTQLDGAPFEYLARPLQILKGRLIAVGLLAIYVASEFVSPFLQLIEAAAFLICLPWLVIRGRAFTLRNSAYRNITFNFRAGYGDALVVYVLWPILIVLSLGTLYPAYVWKRNKFLVQFSGFGAHGFGFLAPWRSFYLAYLKAALFVVAVIVLLVVTTWAAFSSAAAGSIPPLLGALSIPAGLIGLLAALTYLHVAVTNLTWSALEIGGMRTRSELKTPAMFWIAFSSMVAIVASFGLLIPWATIRIMRYRVEQLSLIGSEHLQELLGAQPAEVGATGEELTDLLGVDVAV